MEIKSLYGNCGRCGCEMQPVWFIEYEREPILIDGICYGYYKTGRRRRAVSHLECECCGKKECVDDTFDGAWH